MKKVIPAVIIIAAIWVSCIVAPAPEEVRKVAEYHFTGKYCSDCHEQIPQEGGDKFLKFNSDFNLLCKCHAPANYIHPVGIEPSQEIKAKIPAELPLRKGEITCLTCHDIYRQCQKRRVDKKSLRGRPFRKRSDFCYKCHNKAYYMKLDAHKQLDSRGKIIVESCLYCHPDKPDESRAHYRDVKFVGDLVMLCQRCHVIRGNHAGNFNHMVRPSADTFTRMQEIEKKFGIILPLDENGRLTCITCHNPHDRGVIRAESPAARGAGSKYRHRLPEILCIECHQAKFSS
jgi:hypothetical protein